MKQYNKYILLIINIMVLSSCSTSRAVLSNSFNLESYDYVAFGDESTGDRSLDDMILLVQNEITNTRLKSVNGDEASVLLLGGKKVLTPNIHVESQYWDGGHTFITVTFYDYSTHQQVLVLKSSGIGLTVPHDQKIALKAITKKIQSTFGQ